MREHPALVLPQCFMSVTLTGGSPYQRVLTYAPRRDRARDAPVVGERDRSGRGVRPHGRDVMRCSSAQPPSQNLLFGFGPAHEITAPPDALELGEVPRRLREHRRVEPDLGRPREQPGRRPSAARSLARRGRARSSKRRPDTSWLAANVVRAFDMFVEDVSNWYIRRSRRRFWDGDEMALRTSAPSRRGFA